MLLRRSALLAGAIAGLTACGNQTANAGSSASVSAPPTAKAILAKIYRSGLKDAHYGIAEQLPDGNGGSVQATGDGVLVVKPLADSQSVQIPIGGGSPITSQTIAIGNTIYHKLSTEATWTASPGRSELAYLDETYSATVAGEEMLPQGKAWHLTGTNKSGQFEIWVREKDDFPLKYTSQHSADSITVTVTFDQYNLGKVVVAPPPGSVVQGS